MSKPTIILRMCLGGAVCGCFAGILLGAILGISCGAVAGKLFWGLDGAMLGGLGGALAGSLFGFFLGMAEAKQQKPIEKKDEGYCEVKVGNSPKEEERLPLGH